jgi:hypothetical protein
VDGWAEPSHDVEKTSVVGPILKRTKMGEAEHDGAGCLAATM